MTTVNEIDAQELARLRAEDPTTVLVDVREADELAVAALPGAVHIPLAQIPARLAEIPADRPVYVMCHHGGRSERAVRYLAANGRPSAVNVRGGIDAWARLVDPTVARY